MSTPAPGLRRGRILLVDPSVDSALESVRRLDAAGFEVVAVANATRAQHMLSVDAFDAILCEIHLPRIDGFELRHALLSTPHAEIPFYFLANEADEEERATARALGARGIAPKPVSLESLQAVASTQEPRAVIVPPAPEPDAPRPVGEEEIDFARPATADEPLTETLFHCSVCSQPYRLGHSLLDDRLLSTCADCLAKADAA